ncbi:MAG: hypothetical protein J0M18_10710 [Ignavibacteria bacterium]|nr:hypothetical protein [Ignavibacteria bacterium]
MKSTSKLFCISLFKYSVVIFFLSLSFGLISCNTDSPVAYGPLPEASYNWTSQPVPFDSVYGLYAVDANTCFLFSHGVKKITNGIITEITVEDTSFNWIGGFTPYSSDYYIFSGNKVSNPETWVIKIFDNGTYTDYFFPGITNTGVGYVPYIISKNKFFVFFDNLTKYYLFDNGVMTLFEFEHSQPSGIGKSNGNLYMFCRSTLSYSYDIFKITDSGPLFIRTETVNGPNNSYSSMYFLQEDFIKVTQADTHYTMSYFTESGWTDFHSYDVTNSYHRINTITGKSRTQFLTIKSTETTGNLIA